jgi:hypothetical protein
MFSRARGSSKNMTDSRAHPRRYFADREGRRVIIGLTIDETFEFETLDNLPPRDANSNHVAFEEKGILSIARSKRWLDLYGKHETAWRQWLVEAGKV